MTAEHYLTTYHGRELLNRYSINQLSTWIIYGESCNPDGYCTEPILGVFTGTLQDAIKVAVSQPKFVTWGTGGKIRECNVLTLE